jgi:hypothetical protein
MHSKSLNILFVILSLFSGTLANRLQAQNRESFSGKHNLNGDKLEGVASFKFLITNKKDTILDGPFKFEFLKKENGYIHALSYDGQYRNGQGNSNWSVSLKQLKSDSAFAIENFNIKYGASGTEKAIRAIFNQGVVSNKWVFTNRIIEGGEVRDTLFILTSTFKDGKPIGEIAAKQSHLQFTGTFDNQGYGNELWIFENTKIEYKDITIFENGFFTGFESIERNNKKNTIKLIAPEKSDGLDSVSIVDFFQDIFPYFIQVWRQKLTWISEDVREMSDSGAAFIANAIEHFYKLDTLYIWSQVSGINVDPKDFGKILLYTYSKDKEEDEFIKNQINKQREIQKKIATYKSHPQRSFGVLNEKDFAFQDKIIDEFLRVSKINSNVLEFLGSPANKYISTDSLLQYIIPEIIFPKKIEFTFEESKQVDTFSFPATDFNKDIQSIFEYLSAFEASFEGVFQKLENKLDRLLKESALSDLESELVRKRDSILFLFSSNNNEANEIHNSFFILMTSFTDDTFKEYAKLSIENKRDSIDYYLNCFESAINIYSEISDVPRKLKRIDDLFTRTIWNPYLMVDMEERVKERVYLAFENVLMPYVLNELKSNISCEHMRQNADKIQILYDRMLSIRDEDTREQERALRREKNVETIMGILKIEF